MDEKCPRIPVEFKDSPQGGMYFSYVVGVRHDGSKVKYPGYKRIDYAAAVKVAKRNGRQRWRTGQLRSLFVRVVRWDANRVKQ